MSTTSTLLLDDPERESGVLSSLSMGSDVIRLCRGGMSLDGWVDDRDVRDRPGLAGPKPDRGGMT
jgi:hypothetical protein